MKCLTLSSNYQVIPPSGVGGLGLAHGGYTVVYPESRPKPRPGIKLSPADRKVTLGYNLHVPLSDELLSASPDSGAIVRDGDNVTLLRASVEVGADGSATLVPEKADEETSALVLLNIGSGSHLNVTYRTQPGQVVAQFSEDVGLGCTKECLLLVLKPFEPVVAVRSSKKYWLWGPMLVREVLTIKYDGQNLFYDVQHP